MRRQAKRACIPSSPAISSLDMHRPGSKPRPLIQNMAANDDEKKTPSTIANATNRVAKSASVELIHFRHQSAFALTAGIVYRAENKRFCSAASLISSWMRMEYVSEWTFSLQGGECDRA